MYSDHHSSRDIKISSFAELIADYNIAQFCNADTDSTKSACEASTDTLSALVAASFISTLSDDSSTVGPPSVVSLPQFLAYTQREEQILMKYLSTLSMVLF